MPMPWLFELRKMNIKIKIRVMKIIHHAILDGKLEINQRDATLIGDTVLIDIRHGDVDADGVGSTWFACRHISVLRLSYIKM